MSAAAAAAAVAAVAAVAGVAFSKPALAASPAVDFAAVEQVRSFIPDAKCETVESRSK